ncbi:hypothetical protein [Galbibacter pacificus]|uniref:Helix-turn-helix domain-containing protein n=1 Tax=Galbibacter pacificus TaxID=2996052 RepID=A0ABT6FRN7_9FLAO|nr:hypothetical protein [Galbibacter pacificus]MDG3582952.1 hypothetical protein [Galbibacter pacificus]MDG3585929.1 hypothetical protein [Galbibacter pacificus]
MTSTICLIIPQTVLSLKTLKPNDKLVYGIHYALSKKKGYTRYTNVSIARMLGIHPNLVGQAQMNLIEAHLIEKNEAGYVIVKNELYQKERNIYIFYPVYSYKLNPGAKLLWGEYNSFSKGREVYFASREYSALRLGVSVQSITAWTKQLFKEGFLTRYETHSGGRKIVTKSFESS